jgi:hypothetical protein
MDPWPAAWVKDGAVFLFPAEASGGGVATSWGNAQARSGTNFVALHGKHVEGAFNSLSISLQLGNRAKAEYQLAWYESKRSGYPADTLVVTANGVVISAERNVSNDNPNWIRRQAFFVGQGTTHLEFRSIDTLKPRPRPGHPNAVAHGTVFLDDIEVALMTKAVLMNTLTKTACPLAAGEVHFGDRFIQVGDWRIGDVDGRHLVIAFKGGNVSKLFGSDAALYSGSKMQEFGKMMWARKSSPASGIFFGRGFIQLGDWRIGETQNGAIIVHKDFTEVHRYMKSGALFEGRPRSLPTRIFQEPADIPPLVQHDQVYDWGHSMSRAWEGEELWHRPIGRMKHVYFGRNFFQLGAVRFQSFSGLTSQDWIDIHGLEVSHKDGNTSIVFRSDGTSHKGPLESHINWHQTEDICTDQASATQVQELVDEFDKEEAPYAGLPSAYLVAYYDMHPIGDTIYDRSGHHRHGTLVSATTVPDGITGGHGVSDAAVAFSGHGDSYAILPIDACVSGAHPRTISFWLRVTYVPQEYTGEAHRTANTGKNDINALFTFGPKGVGDADLCKDGTPAQMFMGRLMKGGYLSFFGCNDPHHFDPQDGVAFYDDGLLHHVAYNIDCKKVNTNVDC